MTYQSLLAPILSFLHCETPDAWIDAARRPENLQLLLTDHLVCELKAAQTGMVDPPLRGGQRAATRCWRCCPYEAFLHEAQGAPDTLFRQGQFTRKILPKTARPTARIWRIAWCC